MKVVYFSSDNSSSSGAFRVQINAIKNLTKNGHQVHLITPYGGSGNKLIKENNINHKTIFSIFWVCFLNKTIIDILFYLISLPINFVAKLRIKHFLRKFKPDLAIVNTAWNGVGGAVALKLKIPVIWYLQEVLKCEYRRFFNQKKSAKIISQSQMIICVSEFVHTQYSHLLPFDKMIVEHNRVDISRFYNPNKKLFEDKTLHIIMVGGLSKVKRQYIAVQALNQLSNYDFDITFVGLNPKAWMNKLYKIGDKIKSKMIFTGVTSDVVSYYRKADLFIMSSIGDSFALVNVEAMLSGLPVLVARAAGNIEAIKSEDNGYFYSPDDVNDLKEKIVYIFNHHDDAKKRALNGQKFAYDHFSSKKSYSNIEKYLSSLKTVNK